MTHLRLTLLASFTLLLSAMAPSAFAHSISMESSMISGLLHPFSGLDHLLAMLAVGFWAAQQQGKSKLTIPAVFMSFLLLGFGLGLNMINLVSIEIGIALSVLILGLLMVSATRLPMTVSLPLIGVFALYHGAAHGSEVGLASATLFASGFMLSTALIQLIGAQSASIVNRLSPLVTKVAGSAIALTGALLLVP